MEYYQCGPPPKFDTDVWYGIKYTLGQDFPNLPYVKDGDLIISESMAIYQYLVETYAPDLLGKNKWKVIEGLNVLKCMKDAITLPCYNPDPKKGADAIVIQAKQIELV